MKTVKEVKKILVETGWVLVHLSIPYGLGFIISNTGIGHESGLVYGSVLAIISLYIKAEINEYKIEKSISKDL